MYRRYLYSFKKYIRRSRAVYSIDLRLFDCWDRGFESPWGMGICHISVVCSVGRDLCDGPITRLGKPYQVFVSSCYKVQQKPSIPTMG